MVRRGSVWCGVAQLVARRLAGRLGSTGRLIPTEHKCIEEMKRGLGEWRWVNVWYHCMNVIRNACIGKDKINKKCGNRHQTLAYDPVLSNIGTRFIYPRKMRGKRIFLPESNHGWVAASCLRCCRVSHQGGNHHSWPPHPHQGQGELRQPCRQVHSRYRSWEFLSVKKHCYNLQLLTDPKFMNREHRSCAKFFNLFILYHI